MEETGGAVEESSAGRTPDYLQLVLNSGVGWDVRHPLPKLNDENRALVEEICKTHRQLVEIENQLGKNREEKQEKDQAIRNIRELRKNTEALIKVKESELEVERHLTALKQTQNGHLLQKSSRTVKELQAFAERETSLKDRIFKAKQKLEEFRLQRKWDQQTMEAFLKDSAQKHQDMMAVIKYSHQDDERIKSLTGAINKETLKVSEQRKALDKAVTENRSAQMALDKATENLLQAHAEIQQLSSQWGNTVKQMKQRDAEMQKCAQVLVQTRQDVRAKMATVTECEHLLDTQRNNNKETARRLTVARQQAGKLKQHLDTEHSNCHRLQDELKGCQDELNKATTEVKSLRAGMSQMKKEIEDNDGRMQQAAVFNAALEEKLRVVMQTALSEEERAAQMEHFLKDEEQAVKDLDTQLRVSMQELTASKQHLQAAKSKEKILTLQVSESKTTIKTLEGQIRKQEEELRRLEKITFHQDAKTSGLQKHLSRLQGNVSSDERQTMEGQIADLSKELEEKEKSANILTNAIKESENNIRRLRKEKEKTEAKKADLTNKNRELFVVTDLKEKELMRLRLTNQEKLVHNQITKAETERLSDRLHNNTESVHSSEVRKLDLQRAMKEREVEIRAQKETLSRQLHITEQDRHQLRLELNNKLRRLDIMKNRCEILLSTIDPEVDPEKAQAHCIIKFAQEKEELRQKRDALDARLQKTLLENEAMENTNLLWQHRTSSIRQNLHRVDEGGPEYQEKLRLEEQLKAVQEVLRSKKRHVQELQADIQEKENTLGSLDRDQQEVKTKIEAKQQLLSKLQKTTSSHQESIDRLNKQCSRLSRRIRKGKKTREETLEEKDIRLKEAKQFSRKLDQMLTEAMESSPDLHSVMERYFLEANLPLPSPTQSRQTSSRGSVGGSRTLRSPASSISSSPRSSARSSAALNTVTLGMELPVTPPTNPPTPTPPTPSSAGSRKRPT